MRQRLPLSVVVCAVTGVLLVQTSAPAHPNTGEQGAVRVAQTGRQREYQEAQERRQRAYEESQARRQREYEEALARRQREYEEALARRQQEFQQAQEARRREREQRERESEAERKRAEEERQAQQARENEKQQTLAGALANIKRIEARLQAEGRPAKLCAVLLDGFRYKAPYAGDLANAERVFEPGYGEDDVLPVLLHEGSWLKVDGGPITGPGWVPASRAAVLPALPSGNCKEGGLGDGRYMTVTSGRYFRGPTSLFGYAKGSYKAETFLEYPEGTSDWVGEGLFLKDWMPRDDVVFVPNTGGVVAAQTRAPDLKVYGAASTDGPTVFTIRDEGAYLLLYDFVEATKMFRITPHTAPRPGFVLARMVRDRRDWQPDVSAAAHYLNYFAPPPPPRPRAAPRPATTTASTGCFVVVLAAAALFLLIRFRRAVWRVVKGASVGTAVFLYNLYDGRRQRRSMRTGVPAADLVAMGDSSMASDDPPVKRGKDPLGIPQFEPRAGLLTTKLASLAHQSKVAAATQARKAHLEAQADLVRAAKELGVAHVELFKTEEDYEVFSNPELRALRVRVRRLEVEAQEAELELRKSEVVKKTQRAGAAPGKKVSPLEESVRRRREIEDDCARLCAEEDERCEEGTITREECERRKANTRDQAQAMIDRL